MTGGPSMFNAEEKAVAKNYHYRRGLVGRHLGGNSIMVSRDV